MARIFGSGFSGAQLFIILAVWHPLADQIAPKRTGKGPQGGRNPPLLEDSEQPGHALHGLPGRIEGGEGAGHLAGIGQQGF